MDEPTEVRRDDLRVGDTLVSKGDPRRKFRIEQIGIGINGHGWPYLVLKDQDGRTAEHDTSFDAIAATYSVLR